MDYTVHGILKDRILESVAVPSSRGSFQPRNWTEVSGIAGRFFTSWVIREAQHWWVAREIYIHNPKYLPKTSLLIKKRKIAAFSGETCWPYKSSDQGDPHQQQDTSTACTSWYAVLRIQHHICIIPAESTQPDSDHSEAPGKPKLRNSLQITGLNDSKVSRSRNGKGLNSCSRTGKAKKTWQLNSMQKPRLDSGQRMKIYYWESWQNLKVDVDSITMLQSC